MVAKKQTPAGQSTHSATLDTWLQIAERNLLNGIFNNISPPDGKPGSVIASPSRSNPDYYYHWTRDSARTMREIARLCETNAFGLRDKYLEVMDDYISFSRLNQQTPNPSGNVGEPKFYVTGHAYEGEWGRPQNDGPAQRALTLTRWARYLLSQGEENYVRDKIFGVDEGLIKTDLDYIANHWQDGCFDVWEEVEGDHFYTRMIQHAALREGAELADDLGNTGAASFYHRQAGDIESAMNDFWYDEGGYYLATLNRQGGLDYKSSGLDIAVLLGVFQGASVSHPYLTAANDRVLSTALKLYEAFDSVFPVNGIRTSPSGERLAPGIGRYPEDQYSGTDGVETGNPWFLCTGTMAGICYQAAMIFSLQESITLTHYNEGFLQLAASYCEADIKLHQDEVYEKGSEAFSSVVDGLISLGDACLRRIQFHCGDNDAMSEQFHYQTGEMLSADNLTWSYVNVLSCIGLRKQFADR